MNKETANKAQKLVDDQHEVYYLTGLIEAIENPPSEKARQHVLEYLKFRRGAAEQRIRKDAKELVKELETIKNFYVNASNN